MFTNWLTGTSSTGTTNTNNNPNTNTNNNNSEHFMANSATFATNLLSTPPDVVLEVGPAPGNMRFMAHGLILAMHSGYLRSAIRLDEQQLNNNAGVENHANNQMEIIIYLTNVTAEQFAPLLTYMYTGYLDLNVENIFGVLLATHVLHMPRALEICRGFLARAQTDGYLGNTLSNLALTSSQNGATTTTVHAQATISTNTNNGIKIVRPIPSKPTLPPHFAFLPTLPAPQQLAALQLTYAPTTATTTITNTTTTTTTISEPTTSTESTLGEEIDVDRSSSRSSSIKDKQLIKTNIE